MPTTTQDHYPARYLAMTTTEFLADFRDLDAPSPDGLAGEFAGYPHLGDTPESFARITSSALNRASANGYWIGKAFTGGADSGEGYNRAVATDGQIRRGHTFVTTVEPSIVDGKPSLVLAYAASPPGYEGVQLRDEIRQVGAGLYLGLAMTIGPSGELGADVDPFVLTGPVGDWVGPDPRG